VPAVLAANAELGVPTLADLKLGFTAPARAALDASRRELAGGSAGQRIGAFLQTQLGARSTVPRDGDGPDAILSRAEAAIAEGALNAALAELSGLPAAGQAEMADWVAMAQTRIDAQAAIAALTAQFAQE